MPPQRRGPAAWERRPPPGWLLLASASRSRKALAVLAILALLAISWWLVYATGGTHKAFAHIFYLPVIAGAWAFGATGGVVAGVAAGLVAGPMMPLDVAAGIPQQPANWGYRLGFFVLVGVASGAAAHTLTRQVDALQASESRFSSVVENAADLLLVQRRDGTISYASPSSERILGLSPADLSGTSVAKLLHPADRDDLREAWEAAPDADPAKRDDGERTARLEVRAKHADGVWRHLEVTVSDLPVDDAPGDVLLSARDVTERRTMEAQLIHQALHDNLTGLANRSLFVERLDQALAAEPADGIAVYAISLERIRAVRETYGHDAGDLVVCAIADRLRARLRHGDVLSRHDGAEFALSSAGTGDPADAQRVAQRMLAQIEEPLLIDDEEVFISASIGVTTVACSGERGADALLQDAYTAMRHAAAAGGSRCELYAPEWRAEAASWLKTESALYRALDRGELRIHYQPIVGLTGHRIVSCEALLRWQHPTLGLVPPSEFVPIAEKTGMIVPVGAWVLQQATRQLRAWQQHYPDTAPRRVSVNLSPRQLEREDLAETVSTALRTSGLPPEALTLEITEAMLVGDAQMRQRLMALKALGVGLAIDDFGTGYSSLGYLQELPADALKIDRSFIREVGGAGDEPIVSAVIGLAHRLGLETVAEGVETAAQADWLQSSGCDLAQGYLFARPQTAEAVSRALAEGAIPVVE